MHQAGHHPRLRHHTGVTATSKQVSAHWGSAAGPAVSAQHRVHCKRSRTAAANSSSRREAVLYDYHDQLIPYEQVRLVLWHQSYLVAARGNTQGAAATAMLDPFEFFLDNPPLHAADVAAACHSSMIVSTITPADVCMHRDCADLMHAHSTAQAWQWQKDRLAQMCNQAATIPAAVPGHAATQASSLPPHPTVSIPAPAHSAGQAAQAGIAAAAAAAAVEGAAAHPAGLDTRDTLFLLQHPPVYTLGAGSTPEHLRFDPSRPPLPLHRTERGGEVTYHGPGQVRGSGLEVQALTTVTSAP